MVRQAITQPFIQIYSFNLVLDIDECSSNSHSCDVNAVCNNTRGSYTCACKSGYSGDGTNCTGMLYLPNKNYKIYGVIKRSCEMKSHHMKNRLFAHSLGRVFSGPSFCNFLVAIFPRLANKILLHCRNNTNEPHMQNLVDAVYLKTSLYWK